MVFVFLEELNENIRFVRHQIRAFREGISAMREDVELYREPERSFKLHDALITLDDKWEHPRSELQQAAYDKRRDANLAAKEKYERKRMNAGSV